MERSEKGERRAARKVARAAGQPWSIETGVDGRPEIVRERTAAQERRHERAMEQWTRRIDADPDWR